MFAHGVMTALFFAVVVGRMIYDRTHTRQLFAGRPGVCVPVRRVLFHPGRLLLDGHVRYAGFYAEFQYLSRVWQRFLLVAILAGISIPITAAYILRAVRQVFFGEIANPEFPWLPRLTGRNTRPGRYWRC